MRYTIELEVNLPRERMLEVFLDRSNTAKWQPGFISSTPISGTPGTVGAKDRQLHQQGNREQEIVETITVMNPPHEVAATYEGGSVWNLIENHFQVIDESKTKWVLTSEFRSSNLFMRLLTIVAPGMFKKQTKLFMEKFREFAESHHQ